MKCQNRINGVPCKHEALFILRPNCCNMHLCQYCAAYARMFTDDILDISEGVTFSDAEKQHKDMKVSKNQNENIAPKQLQLM